MDIIIYISILVLLALYSFKRVTFHLHMFQLNSYRVERYFRFLRSNARKMYTPSVIFYIATSLVASALYTFISEFRRPVIAVVWLLMTLLRLYPLYFTKERVKKPLAYTMRVKRILFVVLAWYVIGIALMPKDSGCMFWAALLMFSAPWIMLLSNMLLKPVELYLKRYYYNDAKKILKNHDDLIVVGVTGSYGKTSTKFILETILSQQFSTLVTPHSYNTTLGVVITVRSQLNLTHEVFVAEMGAKQKGDIREICDLVVPDYGVITAVGPQHLETFGSLSNIIDTKFELAVASKKKCFVNGDSTNIHTGMERYSDVKYMTYGSNEDNKVSIEEVSQNMNGSEFTIVSDKGKYRYQTRLLGMHNILNIAGAVSVAMELGMSHEKIALGVKELKPVEHRLELKRQNDYYILDDAFNSNPTGAKFALDVLGKFETGQKIIMTPGMIELGDMDEEVHFEFGRQIAAVCDRVILIGENKTRHIKKGLEAAAYDLDKVKVLRTVYEGFAYIHEVVGSGDVVLIENDLPDNFNE